MTSEEFRNNPLFLRNQFDGNGTFEMPVIQKQDVDLDNVSLIGYDKTKSGDKAGANSFVHFFLDDYKFDSRNGIWIFLHSSVHITQCLFLYRSITHSDHDGVVLISNQKVSK